MSHDVYRNESDRLVSELIPITMLIQLDAIIAAHGRHADEDLRDVVNRLAVIHGRLAK